MKCGLILGALAAVGSARHIRRSPQEFQWSEIDEATPPPVVVVPIGAVPETITYVPAAAAAAAVAEILADPLPQLSVPGITKRTNSACGPQPLGSGPVPSPDTASAFLSYPAFAAAASAAPVPPGYVNTFTNLKASSQAYGYMGYTVLTSYSSVDCAAACNGRAGCSAFNLFFERDPSVEPAAACRNPPSTTVIKCVFWGGPVTAENAQNTGQWRELFENGVSTGQNCALYTRAWDSSYATNTGQYRGNDKYTITYSYSYVNSTNSGMPVIPCPVQSATSAILASTLQPYCSSLLEYTTPVITQVLTESSIVPSTTVVVTEASVTTETVTVTTLTAVTNIVAKREATAAAIAQPKLRRDATPPALTAFPSDVISSACSLQATPVSTTSTILATTTVTVASGEVLTTVTLGASTATATETVVITTTINVSSSAPSGVIGYLKISPMINPNANYALSDPDTHMTDNFFFPANREVFIVSEDGYLYSVSNNAWYYTTGAVSGLLFWSHNKALSSPFFSDALPDASGNFQVQMEDPSTQTPYVFCSGKHLSGDRNSKTGYHIHAYRSTIPNPANCAALTLTIEKA